MSGGATPSGTAAIPASADRQTLADRHNRIDLQRPDAPALAAFGPRHVGVRTVTVVDEGRLDIVNAVAGEEIPTYDRPLTLEIWYPASLGEGATSQGAVSQGKIHQGAIPQGAIPRGTYTAMSKDGTTQVELRGRALRNATPDREGAPYPVVILSHGYPGNRFLLSHFGENLASKGYVVASIDHTDSTYSDQGPFASTLYNRPLDQLFVLETLARMSGESAGFLAGLADATNTGIIGYSMGGYGVVNVIGGGFTRASTEFDFAPPNRALAQRQAGSDVYEASLDPRIRAAIAIAPWGMNVGFWDAEGLAGIQTPVMFMSGSIDDVSGYETGTRAIFEAAVNADRYLLTFQNANHNAAAPIPAPIEAWRTGAFDHYADPVWDTVRMNNIAQHFATAYFDLHLKDDADMDPYLDLIEEAQAGVWSVDDVGEFTEEHTYWRGFPNRTAAGLRLEHLRAGVVPAAE